MTLCFFDLILVFGFANNYVIEFRCLLLYVHDLLMPPRIILVLFFWTQWTLCGVVYDIKVEK
jgi:hypothetical protein